MSSGDVQYRDAEDASCGELLVVLVPPSELLAVVASGKGVTKVDGNRAVVDGNDEGVDLDMTVEDQPMGLASAIG